MPPWPTDITGLVYSPAHRVLMVMDPSSVVAVDLDTRTPVVHFPNWLFSDLQASPTGNFVFAADYGGDSGGQPTNPSYVHRFDLSTRAWDTKQAYIAYQVQPISDTQLFLKSRDQWVTFTNNAWTSSSSLVPLNTSSGGFWGPGYYPVVYFGDFRYHVASGRLIHGNSNESSQEIQAFNLLGNDFQKLEGTGIYGSAQGYGGSVALATDGSAFYYGRLAVDPLNVGHALGTFPETIFAATGSTAFGDGTYYDAHTGFQIGSLRIHGTVYGLNPAGSDFWIYEPATHYLRRYAHRPFVAFGPRRDFNGDDHQDLHWQNVTSGQSAVWLMNGLTTTSSAITLTDPNWKVSHVADLDGDLRTDLVWRNAVTGQTAVWLMKGVGVTAGQVISSDPAWTVTHFGDFDDDGKADLIWRNSVTGATALWMMDGLASTATTYLLSDPNWSVTQVADLDGDGKSDLVWRNAATGQTAVWLMNGLHPSTIAVIYSNPQWSVTHVADLDGDGKADLVWRNAATGQTAVWLMNGVTASATGTLFGNANWSVVLAADLDGDGKADLVWENAATGQTAAWLMNGLATKSSAILITDPNWMVTHSADLDGDGKADLIWRNVSNGQTAAWLMNGTVATSATVLTSDAHWSVSPVQGR